MGCLIKKFTGLNKKVASSKGLDKNVQTCDIDDVSIYMCRGYRMLTSVIWKIMAHDLNARVTTSFGGVPTSFSVLRIVRTVESQAHLIQRRLCIRCA
jgi:hypothetical protein